MGQIKRPQYWIATGAIITVAMTAGAAAPVFAADPCAGAEGDSTAVATQRREQCAASKAAKKAKTNDTISAGLWAAVTGVCTASCFRADWGDGGAWCTYSNWAGVGADILLSKDVAQGIASSLPGVAMNYIMKETAEEGAKEQSKAKFNKASCLTAVMAAAKTFQKYSSAKDNARLADEASQNAGKLSEHQGTTVAIGGRGDATTTGIGGRTGTVSGSGAPAPEAEDRVSQVCASAEGSSNSDAHISCALAGDSSLAPILDPKFKKEFEKAAGKPLGEFLANADKNSPEGNMLSAMSGLGMNGDQARQVAAALQKTKDSLPYDVPGAIAARRGGGGGKAGSDDDGMAELMAGLMGQLMPKEGEGEPPAGFSLVDYKSLTRSPSAVAEDRSINIFQRVSFRYHYVGRRVLSGGR